MYISNSNHYLYQHMYVTVDLCIIIINNYARLQVFHRIKILEFKHK